MDAPRNNPEGLITWEKVEKKMNWGVLLLLGGGYTLSNGCSKSGLSGKLTLREKLCEITKKFLNFKKKKVGICQNRPNCTKLQKLLFSNYIKKLNNKKMIEILPEFPKILRLQKN